MIDNYNPGSNVGGTRGESMQERLLSQLHIVYSTSAGGTIYKVNRNCISQHGGTTSLGTYQAFTLTGMPHRIQGTVSSVPEDAFIDCPLEMLSNNITCYLAIGSKLVSGTANARVQIQLSNTNSLITVPNNEIKLFNLTEFMVANNATKFAILYQAMSKTADSERETWFDFIVVPNTTT